MIRRRGLDFGDRSEKGMARSDPNTLKQTGLIYFFENFYTDAHVGDVLFVYF